MAPTTESPRHTTTDLIARAVDGDQVAWTELFERSYPKIRRSIRRRMDSRLRRRCDSVDIANSVMKDFCAKIGQLEFESMQAMEAFLIKAADQKLIDEHRRQHGLKRNVRLERPAEVARWVATKQPSASTLVELDEDYDQILRKARSDEERQIVEMRRDGESNEDISDSTGFSPRTIQRCLQRLKQAICG